VNFLPSRDKNLYDSSSFVDFSQFDPSLILADYVLLPPWSSK